MDPKWQLFFVGSGVSNLAQAAGYFFAAPGSKWDMARLLGTGRKSSSPAIWGVVAAAGVCYGAHGVSGGSPSGSAIYQEAIAGFGALKLMTAASLYRMHLGRHRGPWSLGGIAVTELALGTDFVGWYATADRPAKR